MSKLIIASVPSFRCLILVLIGCATATGQISPRPVQRFEREPEDQTTVVGETVVLGCRVINKAGVLQWTKDDFGLGSDRNLSGFERYSMIGSDEEGKVLCNPLITSPEHEFRQPESSRVQDDVIGRGTNCPKSRLVMAI